MRINTKYGDRKEYKITNNKKLIIAGKKKGLRKPPDRRFIREYCDGCKEITDHKIGLLEKKCMKCGLTGKNE